MGYTVGVMVMHCMNACPCVARACYAVGVMFISMPALVWPMGFYPNLARGSGRKSDILYSTLALVPNPNPNPNPPSLILTLTLALVPNPNPNPNPNLETPNLTLIISLPSSLLTLTGASLTSSSAAHMVPPAVSHGSSCCAPSSSFCSAAPVACLEPPCSRIGP